MNPDHAYKLPVDSLPMPTAMRRRFDLLLGQRTSELRTRDDLARRLAEIEKYLAIAPAVEEALDRLSQQLFGDLIRIIETQLSAALREVLEQPIDLKVQRDFKRSAATLSFHIERSGQREDILRGQGGSVANVLSVGLRLFALTTLQTSRHRRFLVLDEQDCWLRPDLVPRLVRIIHEAGRKLGFQILLISHHDVSAFQRYAEKIFRFNPTPDGVTVKEVFTAPQVQDPD